MTDSKTGKPKGILNPNEGDGKFQLSRFTPAEDLQYFIEHYWIVEWDLGKGSYRQDILAYPSVHLVFERNQTAIFGVVTGKFSRVIKGKGNVLGISSSNPVDSILSTDPRFHHLPIIPLTWKRYSILTVKLLKAIS